MADKQEHSDKLSTENAERKYAVDSLGQEVVIYDEALSAANRAQERWKDSSKSIEREQDVVKKLLVDKTGLEESLRVAAEKAGRFGEVVSSILETQNP